MIGFLWLPRGETETGDETVACDSGLTPRGTLIKSRGHLKAASGVMSRALPNGKRHSANGCGRLPYAFCHVCKFATMGGRVAERNLLARPAAGKVAFHGERTSARSGGRARRRWAPVSL